MSPPKNNAAREDLLNRKILILRLYYVNRLTSDQIRAELEKRGLNVSLYDLDSTMRKWGFEKNINKATWKFLTSILGKRSREGKKSEVIHCGRRVKQSTINKETNRHRDNPTFRPHVPPQSPPPIFPGSQVAVCTPPPHSMEFDWLGGLPWQEFINGGLYEDLHQIVMHERLMQHVEDSNSAALQLDKYHMLLNIDVSYSSSRTSNGSSPPVSKIGARIGAAMPEAYPGENLRRANCLLRGSRDQEFVFECLTLLIYTFSNNITDQFSPKFNSQWEAALAIIKHSAILNRAVDLKRFNSLTIEGFAENLFRAAMHKVEFYDDARGKEAVAIVIWLLESGQNPNDIRLSASSFYRHPQTPLQRALVQHNPNLVRHLLEAKADPNIVPEYYRVSSLPLSPLEMAAKSRCWDISLPLLIKHGASANIDKALHMAIRVSHLEAARLLLENGANPYTAYKTREGLVYEDTALNVAAATGVQELKFIQEFIESPSQSKTLSSLITADTFVAAALEHNSATYLSQYQLSGTSLTNAHGITPLHVAVRESDFRYCRSHLHSYDLRTLATPIPPLWLACILGDEEIARLFIENGADVEGAATTDIEKCRRVLDLDPSDEYESTPLGCTMKNPDNKHLSCAVMLIEAGATLTGLELFVAAGRMHFDLLSAALAAGADPNARNSEGKRPLQITLEGNSHGTDSKYAVLEQLLEKGAIVSQDEVITAIYRSDWDFLELLLSHGGNLLDPNEKGITPLEASIRKCGLGLLHRLLDDHPRMYNPGSICAALGAQKYCIAKGLVANRPTRDPLDIVEMIVLGMAAARGNVEVYQELLTCSSLSKVSYSPRERFCSCGRFWCKSSGVPGSPLTLLVMPPSFALDAFCGFLELGFQPDHRTWLAIAVNGEVRYAEVLLGKGYKLEAQQDELPGADLDPLCVSIRRGKLGMFEILLKAGASFIRELPYSIHLVTAIECRQWSMMETLLTSGAVVNGHPPEGLTALQAAVKSGRLEVVNLLLEAGADVNQWNKDIQFSRSPLQSAVEQINLEMIEALLEAGAEVNAPPAPHGGATALQLASIKGHVGLAQRLLKVGADVDAPGAEAFGITALEGAAQNGRIDMLTLLLSHGACLTGPGRRQYVRSIIFTNDHVLYHTARKLLLDFGGWSDSDDHVMRVEMQKIHEELVMKPARTKGGSTIHHISDVYY
ncbi:ankyrin repeat-containing domain protein [Xylaria grammica]|nr:ankyrin repeat-containing domain protein [Xylaria grammica]